MSILKLLLILLLISLPCGELVRFDIGNNIIIKPLDFFAVLILIWTTVLYIKEKSFRSSLQWYYFIFPLVGLISLCINSFWLKPTEFFASLLYLFRWVAYLSVFFAFIQTDKQYKKKVMWLLLADGFLVVVIGFLQFFFYPNLNDLFYLGWDNHLYRLFSTFLDPNFVGAFFVLYSIFVAGFLFANGKKNKRDIFIYIIILALTLIATFLTYSRSALLMLIISGTTFFILLQKKKFIFYMLILITIFVILASPFFYIENINLFRFNSTLNRIVDIRKGLTIFKDHPIIGVGFNSYRYAQYKYHYESPHNAQPVHDASGNANSYVFILATTGIIGFAAYAYLWLQLFRKANNKKGIYSVVFISSSIGLFFNSFFNNSLFYAEIMVWMWFVSGFIFEKADY